jgi:hypothetical protein
MKREFPLARVEMSNTIDRLKAIADQAGHALLTEGPVHPDHQLLDLCAEALHYRRLYDEAHAAWRANDEQRFANCRRNPGGYFTDAELKASHAEQAKARPPRRRESMPRRSSSVHRSRARNCSRCPLLRI